MKIVRITSYYYAIVKGQAWPNEEGHLQVESFSRLNAEKIWGMLAGWPEGQQEVVTCWWRPCGKEV